MTKFWSDTPYTLVHWHTRGSLWSEETTVTNKQRSQLQSVVKIIRLEKRNDQFCIYKLQRELEWTIQIARAKKEMDTIQALGPTTSIVCFVSHFVNLGCEYHPPKELKLVDYLRCLIIENLACHSAWCGYVE